MTSAASARTRVGLVGARGYVGQELLKLLAHHPAFEVTLISSRELAGTRAQDLVAQWPDATLRFQAHEPEQLAQAELELLVLALPNKVSAPFVAAVDAARGASLKLLDLSADWRFDPAWQYGWPERLRDQLRGHSRVSNPGCYATGMQTALWPVLDLLEAAQVFGVSGYSGAGTTPSPKNDPQRLRDNLLPYSPIGHMHEREVSHQLGGLSLAFMPHVAPFFQGITLTIHMQLRQPVTAHDLLERYQAAWAHEPLVRLIPGDEPPVVRDAMGRHEVSLGGLAVSPDGRRGVIYATLDNLLKGAATQAVQNMNLMAGHEELLGLPLDP